jgi:hypothetical protein
MDAKGCSNFTEFKATLIQEAKATQPTVFANLVGSMKKRMADCIKRGGGKTSIKLTLPAPFKSGRSESKCNA